MRESKTVVFVALAGNLGIAAPRCCLRRFIRSSTRETKLLLLLGLKLSTKPPDLEHPYGHGRKFISGLSLLPVTAKSSFIAWSNVEAINRGELQTAVNWQLSFCFSKALFANEAMLFEIKENALNPPYPVTYDGLVSQFAAVASHDRRRQLRTIKSPTLVLGAAEDGIIYIDQVKSLALEIKNSQLRILPGGHMYHIEYPEIFARMVTKFLEDEAYIQPDFRLAAAS